MAKKDPARFLDDVEHLAKERLRSIPELLVSRGTYTIEGDVGPSRATEMVLVTRVNPARPGEPSATVYVRAYLGDDAAYIAYTSPGGGMTTKSTTPFPALALALDTLETCLSNLETHKHTEAA